VRGVARENREGPPEAGLAGREAHTDLRLATAAKKGAHGGNVVSPRAAKREDALIMWREPVARQRERASAAS
jgi:hypothetical protein